MIERGEFYAMQKAALTGALGSEAATILTHLLQRMSKEEQLDFWVLSIHLLMEVIRVQQ